MNDEGAPYDSGFDDSGPFADTPPAGGVTLESALHEFGPAAFDDLIPRLRSLAADLDEAHAVGFVHGRLHPSRIIVTDDASYLMGRRVPASGTLTPAADQAAFAVIAYEWMFGRRVSPGAAVAPPPPSGVDRGALSQALTRALSLDRDRQFDSINDFVTALENSQTLLLPLSSADDDDDPVEPFVPESFDSGVTAVAVDPLDTLAPSTPAPFDSRATGAAGGSLVQDGPGPDLDMIDRATAVEPDRAPAFATAGHAPDLVSAEPAFAVVPARQEGPRFSGMALILATIVGALLGFAAGYMARPRALQSVPAAELEKPGTEQPVAATPERPAAAPVAKSDEPKRVAPKKEAAEPQRIGRLLVRSTPPGASVSVDGLAKGVTPLAIRDLDLGSREITVTQRGYESEQRRIVLTKARPSRSVEVRLSASAPTGRSGETASATKGRTGATTPVRPSTPASFGKPAVTTGVLAIESQPPGAAVLLNGKPSGTTPLTINDLVPGEYRVTMTLKGFREFATTVRVVAGERARAAARLTEQEQE